MGCYSVPLGTWVVHSILQRKIPAWQDARHTQLSLLLLGGATFGVVDHAWNGDLLTFTLLDLALGVVITAVIFGIWGVMALRSPVTAKA